jgi:hypothetical protein
LDRNKVVRPFSRALKLYEDVYDRHVPYAVRRGGRSGAVHGVGNEGTAVPQSRGHWRKVKNGQWKIVVRRLDCLIQLVKGGHDGSESEFLGTFDVNQTMSGLGDLGDGQVTGTVPRDLILLDVEMHLEQPSHDPTGNQSAIFWSIRRPDYALGNASILEPS